MCIEYDYKRIETYTVIDTGWMGIGALPVTVHQNI